MGKREMFKRYLLCTVSLFFSALGVAVTKKAELGVSPISSTANVMSIRFDSLTIGSWLIIWNCILILGQIIILRRKFKLIQLLQIPLSFLFGYFTDIGMNIIEPVTVSLYWQRIILVLIGTLILGFGISLSVIANVIMNSGEAFVKALSDTLNMNFGNLKIFFDISCVVLAVILSLAFFDMSVVGTREGTVIAAVLTGFVVKIYMKVLKSPVEKLLLN